MSAVDAPPAPLPPEPLPRPSPVPAAAPAEVPDAWSVSVKTLCAFAAKAGDLDLRFVPAPSAIEGQIGHRLVQGRRGPSYQSEVSLSLARGRLQVRGRADGFDPQKGRLEEIKTFRGDFGHIKSNHRALHWAQAKVYAYLVCARDALPRLEVALVYLDLESSEETVLVESATHEELRHFFDALCTRYQAWAEQEAAHRRQLDASLATLAFPHAGFRTGQRELAEAVYRGATSGRCLMAQAPTGIGKTVATIFPLLKAMPGQRLHKVFFLTAKTPGRALALHGLARIAGEGRAPLRVLELAAREKVCEHPGKACHGESCPLAQGFYDRLPAAREAATERAWLDREATRQVASRHGVCPYFLAQEMVRWSDVVVADYNYYFDSSAFLHALTSDEEWRVSLLVDEAHNLLERARGMYSATLSHEALAAAREMAPASARGLLLRLQREWLLFTRDQEADHAAHEQIPERLLRALQEAVSALADHFNTRPSQSPEPLQRFFFDALHFTRMADSFGRHSVFESPKSTPSAVPALAIRNLVPAPFLAPRFASCRSATCFSGTLAPFDFYADLLGLPKDTARLDVASPFQAQQLQVRVTTDLSTRWRDRSASLDRLVDVIGAQYLARPGNYLAFFGSFDYLDEAARALQRRHPDVPLWMQSRQMPEAEREAFIARFQAGGCGVGLAVLGGAFGEGIDLPGDRLVGAFVASLGMPRPDAPNEIARERIEALFGEGDGYAYTYLYPGLQKVVQAAGRVIRTEQDDGVLYLLDDRFIQPEVRALLPVWWDVQPWRSQAVARRKRAA